MEYLILKKNILRKGFTLVEILIAIFIFALVILMLYGTFRSTFSTTDAVDETMSTAIMAKICIQRMVADLSSIYVNLPPTYTPPGIDSPEDNYRFVGDVLSVNGKDFPKLRFTSSAHLSFGDSGTSDSIAEIVYYVDPGEEDHFVMKRSDHLFPYDTVDTKKIDPILCEKIKTLAFTYYDEEGAEHEIWDSESPDYKYATPRAVGIALEIGDSHVSQMYKTKIILPVYRSKIE
jgi:general secretion pathway protein J